MKPETKRNKVQSWLKEQSSFINITGIEKSFNAPKGLIQKFIKYDKKIPDKHIEPIYDQIKLITKF